MIQLSSNKRSSRHLLQHRRLVIAALAVITVGAVVVLGNSWKRSVKSPEASFKPTSNNPQASLNNQQAARNDLQASPKDRERIETELVTVTSTGFEPEEITRPQGRFFLAVDNRSEKEIDLHLDRTSGASGRLKSPTIKTTAPEWREEFDLTPGEYVLRDANDPEKSCRIRITAK